MLHRSPIINTKKSPNLLEDPDSLTGAAWSDAGLLTDDSREDHEGGSTASLLTVSGLNPKKSQTLSVSFKALYEVQIWAKGQGGSVGRSLSMSLTGFPVIGSNEVFLTLTDEWQPLRSRLVFMAGGLALFGVGLAGLTLAQAVLIASPSVRKLTF